jgi:hypothetical protein
MIAVRPRFLQKKSTTRLFNTGTLNSRTRCPQRRQHPFLWFLMLQIRAKSTKNLRAAYGKGECHSIAAVMYRVRFD